MAKTRKTRKSVSEPEVPEVEEDAPETKPTAAKKVVKESSPKEFTAILQDATSLTLLGRKFLKNTPTKVPIEHLKLIRDHGWFRVVV